MSIVGLVIEKSGGVLALANQIGVTRHAIYDLIRRNHIPSVRVIQFAKATDWGITPHELRPDLYPHPDDGLPDELRGRNI